MSTRRDFITLLGGTAAAWPLAAGAQQAIPVIGFLSAGSYGTYALRVDAFRRGLREAGFTDGENVTIEYRWAESQMDRLPSLARDLVRRRVAVIATTGNAPALAAKAATTTIPVVFSVSEDPVRVGLVASLARPGGNVTGVNYLIAEVTAKRLELLRALVPGAVQIAVLVNPEAPVTETVLRELEDAAATTRLRIRVLRARSSGEINAAFATFVHDRPDALFVSGGFLFSDRRVQLVHLATRYAVPTAYGDRDYVEVGGLMSYGSNLRDASQQVGLYTGRILKGAQPTELPVMQSTKLELVINAETARTLGLTVPPSLLALADEVIE
jgi:putative tryptophan/tyrosine transport system substrate-binding protein